MSEKPKPVRRKNSIAVSGYDSVNNSVEAEDFQSASSTFIRHCRIRNLSDGTITYYKDVLSMLTRMMESRGIKRPMDVDADAIHECIFLVQTTRRCCGCNH